MKEQLLLLGPSPPSLGLPSGKAPGVTVQEGARTPTGNLHFPTGPGAQLSRKTSGSAPAFPDGGGQQVQDAACREHRISSTSQVLRFTEIFVCYTTTDACLFENKNQVWN